MNNNPICIDVSGMSVEEKKHVQDLLFSLGYWSSDFQYIKTSDVERYGNVKSYGEICSQIMWGCGYISEKQKEHLVTLEQLEKRVREKNELDHNDDQFIAAIKTLTHLGYTYHGGEQWKPSRGEKPNWIDQCEEYQKIDFTKESLFSLEGDLLSGNLYYGYKENYALIENVDSLVSCYLSQGNLGHIHRKVVLSKEEAFKKTLLDIMDKVYDDNEQSCPDKKLIDAIWTSNLFELK